MLKDRCFGKPLQSYGYEKDRQRISETETANKQTKKS